MSEEQKEKLRIANVKGVALVECDTCEEEFTLRIGMVEKQKTYFCSRVCWRNRPSKKCPPDCKCKRHEWHPGPWRGKKMPSEVRAKMSASAKARGAPANVRSGFLHSPEIRERVKQRYANDPMLRLKRSQLRTLEGAQRRLANSERKKEELYG